MVIVDRRANPQGKSLANRERFLKRVREDVKRAVSDTIARRRIADVDSEDEVRVRVDGTEEPAFGTTGEGEHDYVLPGPGTLNRGDRLPKPSGGAADGSGSRAGRGRGEDPFEFVLTREEFLNYFFDELELPHLMRTSLAQDKMSKPRRAGYSVYGQPSALDVRRTMRNSLARRIALRRPDEADLDALRATASAADRGRRRGGGGGGARTHWPAPSSAWRASPMSIRSTCATRATCASRSRRPRRRCSA